MWDKPCNSYYTEVWSPVGPFIPTPPRNHFPSEKRVREQERKRERGEENEERKREKRSGIGES